MDRAIVYTGELLSATDVCYTNQLTMVAIAKLSKAILGSSTLLNDLTCVPTSPLSLSVNLNPGEIYSMQPLEDTAYGPLPPDTSDTILKQGIILTITNFPVTAPATPGQSIDYLIQVTYQDVDTNPENRPFFGSSPMVVETIRRGELIASLKAGIPATTGTQVPPTPDAGYTGAWVITVANGQTTVTSGDISVYGGAPFINATLTQLLTQTQADARYAQLTQFASSLGLNGFINLPGNLKIQWGNNTLVANSLPQQSVTFSFPTPFLSTIYIATASSVDVPASGFSVSLSTTTSGLTSATVTGSYSSGGNFSSNWLFDWIAIGV